MILVKKFGLQIAEEEMKKRSEQNTLNRRQFIKVSSTASLSMAAVGLACKNSSKLEWRNRQSDMVYRRLGRTNMMVSEVIMGGVTIKPDNVNHVEMAIEMGLNFLDTAPAYNGGESEKAFAKMINTSSKREKVFVNSKVSRFNNVRNKVAKEIYETLTDKQQQNIERQVDELMKRENLINRDYTIPYFGEDRYPKQIRRAITSDVVLEQYSDKIEQPDIFYNTIIESVEESLQRLDTDYLDIIMCPHGVSSPGEMEMAEIKQAFDKLKKDGKVRFLGVSAHSDPAMMVETAARLGYYDVVMPAYNFINAKYFDKAFKDAKETDMGIIAMKAARIVHSAVPGLKPPFESAAQKLDRIVPGDMSIPMKSYVWVLQNDQIATVNADMANAEHVKEDLAVVGKKVELKNI
jgi:aryl-alcohol dehydrogenase-like predicted oxidoreductase